MKKYRKNCNKYNITLRKIALKLLIKSSLTENKKLLTPLINDKSQNAVKD